MEKVMSGLRAAIVRFMAGVFSRGIVDYIVWAVIAAVVLVIVGVPFLPVICPSTSFIMSAVPVCVEADGSLRVRQCSWTPEPPLECDEAAMMPGAAAWNGEVTLVEFTETGPGTYLATVRIRDRDPETHVGIGICQD